MRIINNSDTIISIEVQEEIRQNVAAFSPDCEEVICIRTKVYDDGEIYDVYEETEEGRIYLFTIDSDGAAYAK